MRCPEISPNMYGSTDFEQRVSRERDGEGSLGKQLVYMQRDETEPLFPPHAKNNSKLLGELNVKI
jgi:hypothetical protein